MTSPNNLPVPNLQEYLKILAEKGLLREISDELDPNLEIPEIHRRVIDKKGPALLFKNPKGADFPLVTNLFGTLDRIHLAFGSRPVAFIKESVKMMDDIFPMSMSKIWNARGLAMQALKIGMKRVRQAPVTESGARAPFFNRLPITTSWPEDGGPFITLPLVYTEHPVTGHHNLGMYRMQVYDDRTTGMHWQIHKGGGFHYHEAEKIGNPLPVTVFNGGPPAMILSAIAPLPENVPELILASLLLGQRMALTRVKESSLPLVAEAEFAFVGEVHPHERKPEGPFGDHYGYYSLKHDYPVFKAKHFFHRKNAIFSATVVGEPRQEDFFIGDYLQELLSPLFPKVMPSVKELTSYGETGFHSLAAAVVKSRYAKEAFGTGLRILGEGQLSLTKILMMTDKDIAFRPFDRFLEHFLRRTNFRSDIHIFSNISQDTLDYTGPKVNEGSKMLWMALEDNENDLEVRDPDGCPGQLSRCRLYCPGCLVVEARESFAVKPDLLMELLEDKRLEAYHLIILVDDLDEAMENEMKFLWTVFTRFEPAADIKAKSLTLNRYHPEMTPPMFIDARMKPWYPGKLVMDEQIVKQVNQKFSNLFSN